ncbi:hypothetical protein OVA24_08755 [Luteolibacter sp. SL250]|uniref:hypothetical protein n=1 Tax=Luteolibacter sp. SL250 TaxID=2995170 RepID=UPI00226DA4EC|nr:hypothetical protein [Luteolibacter sp. SL250]WAC21475.1 hypothetical protein OVA24_08755 [Luteolibacter sp. SL250]
MKSLLLSLAVLLMPASLHAQAPPAAAADPVLTTFRLDDGRFVKFRNDRTVTVWRNDGGDLRDLLDGKWEADPFSEGVRVYRLTWSNGGTWDMELARDASMIRATTQTGEKRNAHRTDELVTYIRTDDEGMLHVNGTPMIPLPKDGKATRVFIRSGDIITVELKKRGPAARFALEIFRDNRSIISAKDFVYTSAPDPDWKVTANTNGYRPVDTSKLRDFALGNVISPLAATPKGSDEKFSRLFFKYIVP